MPISDQVFDLSGNHLSLDFINTLDDRSTEHPQELLTSYEVLLAWSRQAHILTDDEAQQLAEEAKRQPREAERVLRRAIEVREALFGLFSSIAHGAEPDQVGLASFNAALATTLGHARIVSIADHFMWDWDDKRGTLDWMLWPIVRAAADLLTSDERSAVRVCESDTCNWVFLDTSKNRSRRWCNMRTCGNRAKARRHYERKKETV
jgi:predicted RNA-binding Zn ribbon-like protein